MAHALGGKIMHMGTWRVLDVWQAHAETATLITKNVCVPLVEISSHKNNESKQLCSYRDKFESLLQTGENSLETVGGCVFW